MAKSVTKVTTVETTAGEGAELLPFYRRPFWEVIASLTAEEWGTADSPQHKVRVYRANENWKTESSPDGNMFQGPFDEDTIRARWGGGRYLLWLYGPPDARKVVMPPFQLSLEGPPKFSATHAGNGNANGGSDLHMVLGELLAELRASRGADMTQKAMLGALDLQASALKSGVQTVRELNPAPTAPAGEPSRMEKLFDRLMELSLTRMMNPDPLAEKLQNIMIERLVNPTNPLDQAKSMILAVKDLVGGSGSGKADLGSLANTFLANLPSLADKMIEGVREYRLANEAAERTFRLQKGDKVIDMPAADGTQAAQPQASAAPPAETGVVEVGGPSIEWIQLQIVKAITENPEAAGDWLYDWLEHVVPEMNKLLATQNRDIILGIFKQTVPMQPALPLLKQVAEHPQLGKVVDDYLKSAQEAAKSKPA